MLRSLTLLTCAVALAASGCAALKAKPSSADVALVSASGSSVAGVLQASVVPDGVHLHGRITGLQPGSTHGFHIHERGDCSASDASSAGGHFNPTATEHGDPAGFTHHAGDIANLVADAQGNADVDATVHGVSLGTGTADDVLGRAVIVNADADDYSSQPSGNSGARIACGAILRKNKK